MSALQDLFSAYGGDYDKTMERFMNNENLYYKILPMLFQDNNLQKLGTALETGDFDSAFIAAHTLKGVSANLGLTPLYDAVCRIVEPLRNQDKIDYAPMYQAIQVEFQRVNTLWEQIEKWER